MLLKKAFLTAGLALGAKASLASLAYCDPSRNNEHCPPDLAVASDWTFDFSKSTLEENKKFWTAESAKYSELRGMCATASHGRGIALSVRNPGEGTAIASNHYLLFGKVTVEAQASQGQGVISTIGLKSDTGNELLWELLGSRDHEVQTNYFYDGNLVYNTYNHTYKMPSDVTAGFHNYTVEWTDKNLVFSIDGQVRNNMTFDNIGADIWPQVPMQLYFRIWTVQETSDPGQIAWAGGVPDWTKVPFGAFYRRVHIEDYTGYCKTVHPGPVSYSYDSSLTSFDNVKIHGCEEASPIGVHEPATPHKNTTGIYPTARPSFTHHPNPAPTNTAGVEDPEAPDVDDDVDSFACPGRNPRSYIVFVAIICTIFVYM